MSEEATLRDVYPIARLATGNSRAVPCVENTMLFIQHVTDAVQVVPHDDHPRGILSTMHRMASTP